MNTGMQSFKILTRSASPGVFVKSVDFQTPLQNFWGLETYILSAADCSDPGDP